MNIDNDDIIIREEGHLKNLNPFIYINIHKLVGFENGAV